MTLTPTRRLFSVDEYHRMAKAGILTQDDRVELIEGEIIRMSPIGRRHAAAVGRLNERFWQRFGEVAQLFIQSPVRLSKLDEPEPDLALVRRRPDFYESGLPGPADVLLLIEVADTSIDYDRQTKLPLYARHGIAEVWVLDLNTETISVHRDPGPDGYRTVQTGRRGDRLSLLAFPERDVAVDDLLG